MLTTALPRTVLHVGTRDAERRDKEAAKQLDTLRQQLERAIKAEDEAKARLLADDDARSKNKKEAESARKDAERRVADAEGRIKAMQADADRRVADLEARLRIKDGESFTLCDVFVYVRLKSAHCRRRACGHA